MNDWELTDEEIRDYRLKWLKAERDLALLWIEPTPGPVTDYEDVAKERI